MTRFIPLSKHLLIFGVPLFLLAMLVIMMKWSASAGNDVLNLAITIDLILVVPLVYFLLIRKTKIPKTTVIPILVVGIVLGSIFMPKEGQTYLSVFKTWALPVIELAILTFVIFKVRNALRMYKENKTCSSDFFNALKSTCTEILPKKLVAPFATEVAVFYYGFFKWKSPPLQPNEFTHHKRSGTSALFGGFILIIVVETVALHVVLLSWSTTAAWVLTGLSAYTALQVFGFAKSLSKRPISIHEKQVVLKYGILNETAISLADISRIELSRKPLTKAELTKTLSPLGAIESHNMVIYLKDENELVGLYGKRTKFNVLGLHIDAPNDFKEALEKAQRKLD